MLLSVGMCVAYQFYCGTYSTKSVMALHVEKKSVQLADTRVVC